MKSPKDLVRSHWIWQEPTESGEISPKTVKISPKFRRFLDLQLQPNQLSSVEGQIFQIQSTTPIGGRLKF